MGRQLDKYLETLYGERAGYVYVATKQTNGGFLQKFFHYPDERGQITSAISNSVVLGEVYVCPSLFATAAGTKDQCLGSSVAWVDFDGNYPKPWPDTVPLPSMVVQTSFENRVHAYWKLDSFLSAAEVEEVNRRLSYFFGADLSGWDANQLLRPPETRNHKRGKSVELTTEGGAIHSVAAFIGLPSPPALPKNIEAIKVPPIEEALERITWPANLLELFKNGLPEGKRHQGMFALAAGLAELNVSPPDILSVLLHSDNNAFHKFDTRPDQMIRLIELVTRAVSKVKSQTAKPKEVVEKWIPTPFNQLLTTTYQMEWLWQPYLHKTSCVILSGPPGVGKSLMSLSLAQVLVLGKDFLGAKLPGNLRIGFVSMEMDEHELNAALKIQSSAYSEEEIAKLTENFLIMPFGEPKYFSDKATEKALDDFIGDNHLDGIFIDSLSATTPGDLSSEKETKAIFELDSRLRAKHGCFTWYIHHNRKAQADNKRPNKLADIFGSIHITSKPSTVITLWPLDPKGNRISFKPLKVRSSQLPNDITISRNESLHYVISYDTAGSAAAGSVAIVTEQGKEVISAVGSDGEDQPGDGDDVFNDPGKYFPK